MAPEEMMRAAGATADEVLCVELLICSPKIQKLCQELLVHREQKVRSHILRFVRYDGQSIWRAGRREASEITGESTEKGRDSASGGKCTCDPLREIVEGEMLPCLSNVMSQG